MGKNLTGMREGISHANSKMQEMRDVVINGIRRKIPYLVGTVSQRDGLNNLSPNESIDKIIKDLSELKKQDEFVKLNNEYMAYRKGKMKLEKAVVTVKSEIKDVLDKGENDILSLPLKGLLRPSTISFLCEDLYQTLDRKELREKKKHITLGDLIKFCLEEKDREYSLLIGKGIGPTEIQKIKDLFEEHHIKI